MGAATATFQPSSRKREKLTSLLNETAQAYRKTLPPLEARAYLESWDYLMNEVGEQRFECGLKTAISELQFFPKVDQISARIPAELKLKGRAQWNCNLCDGAGWERVFKGHTVGTESRPEGSPVDPVTGAVRRCPCWTKVEVAA
jgi:hypothetical protein